MTDPVARRRLGLVRGLSGACAAGLAALAAALAVIGVVSTATGSPGPGAGPLLWHAGAAVVALVAQVYADRTPGPRGAAVAVGVMVLVGAVLLAQWIG